MIYEPVTNAYKSYNNPPMFTGIITDIGTVKSVSKKKDTTKITIISDYPIVTYTEGCSISCSGACLTVKEFGDTDNGTWFSVEVSEETISRTTLGNWRQGTKINLEKALRLGDELGGHMVSGHVDATAKVLSIENLGENRKLTISLPQKIKSLIAEKGSITVDGVSLTVNEIDNKSFSVNIIPYTLHHTVINEYETGTEVNLEVDLIARYLSRMVNQHK